MVVSEKNEAPMFMHAVKNLNKAMKRQKYHVIVLNVPAPGIMHRRSI